MLKKLLAFLTLSLLLLIYSCNSEDGSDYVEVPTSPVQVDLTQVPYSKLSDYHFFEGEMKNQNPSLNVIPTNQQVHYLAIMLIKKDSFGCQLDLKQLIMAMEMF